ncbi:unnamed protein product [Clonostachys byssicola]|uniref:LRR-containing protein second PH domain-containing protein n=1 Tax=Clonostachys byssicola TaxID=160290 RepID=A0A9N9XV55_9HYPO|nr:unnamed protein product [Clonostachys byssicola]
MPLLVPEKWKRMTVSSSRSRPTTPSPQDSLEVPEPEPKTPRGGGLSRALRSLSNPSLDSLNSSGMRRTNSAKRLTKTSASSSMIERFQRRYSRDFNSSISQSEVSVSSLEPTYHTAEVLRSGHLKTDVTLLKARSEYLVLTDQTLIKFGSIDAARFVFPQLGPPEARRRSLGSQQLMGSKSPITDIRFEVPLQSIVGVFNEEGASPRFGVEVWWFSQWPRLGYCKAQLFFSQPQDRDEWLVSIQRACRAKNRRSPAPSMIPENLKIRINHIVAANEPQQATGSTQNLIFPVAKRYIWTSQKATPNEETQLQVDGSSFYLVIGPYMCYFLEVLKADHGTAPGDLRIKSTAFGTVTLTRFKASVLSHEQRFVMSFRPPFGRETRLDLASSNYRRIIEALTRMDRILKPMWPQHFQQHIFDIRGLPPPLQLTSGNDLGGIEQSLRAYCAAYGVSMPQWSVNWDHGSQPVFRLIPLKGETYTPLQLMAVFRSLRYNGYFKSISFKDVDLSSLAGKIDQSQGNDAIVHTSINGYKISEEHYEHLTGAPVLTQELHSLAFASESVRSIDLTNVLGLQTRGNQQSRTQPDYTKLCKTSSEMLRPITLLARGQLQTCHTINMSGNPVAVDDIEEFANVLVLDTVAFRSLKFAGCRLGDEGLSTLWTAFAGQAGSLEVIDTSNNQGTIKHELLKYTLRQLQYLRRLNIAGNTRLNPGQSLFEEATLHTWELEELDLSNITLNDATIDVLCGYLGAEASWNLETLRLNQCGLNSKQVALIFRCMGQGRRMVVEIDGNRLDEGIDDLCDVLSLNYGPWSLSIQMVEFNLETSFVQLWKALTVNSVIECLSLAGSATADAMSTASCNIIAEFFSKNESVRFLDISGFDARLDEGHLGREFSHTLKAIRSNQTIEHLRVRSQMLNINIGDLADAISGNKTLHTLDCEDNDFNLSNFRHLVRHLGDNCTIRKFSAFTPTELENVVKKAVMTANFPVNQSRRSSMMLKFRNDKPQISNIEGILAQQLKEEWDAAVAELTFVLERNQKSFEEQNGANLSPPDREGDNIFAASFGGLALEDYESSRKRPQSETGLVIEVGEGPMLPDIQTTPGGQVVMPARTNSTVSSDAAVSPTSAAGSFALTGETPPDGGSISEKLLPQFAAAPEDDHDGSYTFLDGPLGDSDLVMQIYRRPWGETVSCIREEDDGN